MQDSKGFLNLIGGSIVFKFDEGFYASKDLLNKLFRSCIQSVNIGEMLLNADEIKRATLKMSKSCFDLK